MPPTRWRGWPTRWCCSTKAAWSRAERWRRCWRASTCARCKAAGALLHAVIGERDEHWHLARADFDGGSLWLRDEGLPVRERVRVRVLARDVSLAVVAPAPGSSSIQNVLPCTVASIAAGAHPSQVTVQLRCGSNVLLARITARAAGSLYLREGMPVWAQVKSAGLVR